MTILYSLVARGRTVLSEFTFTSGNFPTITRVLLGKINVSRDNKMSYVYDQSALPASRLLSGGASTRRG